MFVHKLHCNEFRELKNSHNSDKSNAEHENSYFKANASAVYSSHAEPANRKTTNQPRTYPAKLENCVAVEIVATTFTDTVSKEFSSDFGMDMICCTFDSFRANYSSSGIWCRWVSGILRRISVDSRTYRVAALHRLTGVRRKMEWKIGRLI